MEKQGSSQDSILAKMTEAFPVKQETSLEGQILLAHQEARHLKSRGRAQNNRRRLRYLRGKVAGLNILLLDDFELKKGVLSVLQD